MGPGTWRVGQGKRRAEGRGARCGGKDSTSHCRGHCGPLLSPQPSLPPFRSPGAPHLVLPHRAPAPPWCRDQPPTSLVHSTQRRNSGSPSPAPLPGSPWVSPVLCEQADPAGWGGWASQRPRFVSALVAMLTVSGAGAQTEISPGPAPAPSPLMDAHQKDIGQGCRREEGCRGGLRLLEAPRAQAFGAGLQAWPFLARSPG